MVASLGSAPCAGGTVFAGMVGLESSVKGNTKSLAVHGVTDTGFGLDSVDKPVDKTDESGVDRLRYDLFFEPEPNDSLPATDEDEDSEVE